MHVYDYLCITVCVLLFICVHVSDFVCDCIFCVCVHAFMPAFVLKALKRPRSCVFCFFPFVPAVGLDYEFMYSLCICVSSYGS